MTQMLERPSGIFTPLEGLPEDSRFKNLGIIVCDATALAPEFIDKIIENSRQEHIMAHEGYEDVINTDVQPPVLGRYHDRDTFAKWAEKGRTMSLLVDPDVEADVPDVAGVIALGRRGLPIETDHPLADGADVTFLIRVYAKNGVQPTEDQPKPGYNGVGIATQFVNTSFKEIAKTDVFSEDQNVWLDVVVGNTAAQKLYNRVGFVETNTYPDAEHPGRMRALMIGENLLRNSEAA